MKAIPIQGTNYVYTCNVYLVLGAWNRLEDVNTLVDVGNDPSIVETLQTVNAGVGKNKVEQVVLTHDHSDHTGVLSQIRKAFRPVVCAFSPFLEGVDRVLRHGDTIRMASGLFEVIHTPGHSSDSICLFNREHGTLFAGDTPLVVRSPGGAYEEGFLRAMENLSERDVRTIYFGHGEPLTQHANETLANSLAHVRAGCRHAASPTANSMNH
jgi:glyoxylase-like metal-dependent hydrolase (beta-lactamase superfamily II)